MGNNENERVRKYGLIYALEVHPRVWTLNDVEEGVC